MINDAARNDAYEAAIVRALAGRGGALVLNVGAGTGLLSMMAARAGARAVACEMVPELAAAATRIQAVYRGKQARAAAAVGHRAGPEVTDDRAATPPLGSNSLWPPAGTR